MMQENEIVMFLLGLGVLIFILTNRTKIERIQKWKFLIAGFYVFLSGWLLTVLEGFFFKEFFNYLEHICYTASSLLITIWCWKVFGNRKETE